MKDKYFDANTMVFDYARDTGRDPGDYLPQMAQAMEPIINKAYRDGYADAQADSKKELVAFVSALNEEQAAKIVARLPEIKQLMDEIQKQAS